MESFSRHDEVYTRRTAVNQCMSQLRELVHLGYQTYKPHPFLRPLVQCYWTLSAPVYMPAPLEYLYPDGCSSLIFDLSRDDRSAVTFAAYHTQQMVSVQGSFFGIRFQPSGAFRLLHLPIHELIGGPYSLVDGLLPEVEPLHLRLQAHNTSEHGRLIDAWLLGRYNGETADPAVKLASLLAGTERPMTKLLTNSGITRRTAERVFKTHTGCSPIQFNIWSRIRKARQLIKLQNDLPLAQIASLCGFYDQAHFIHQFKRTTSFTPGAYLKRQRERLAIGEMAIVREP